MCEDVQGHGEKLVTPYYTTVLEEVRSSDQEVAIGGRYLGGVRPAEETVNSSCTDPSLQQPQDCGVYPGTVEREDEEFCSWEACYLGIPFGPRNCQQDEGDRQEEEEANETVFGQTQMNE